MERAVKYENSEGRVLNIMPSGMGVGDESGATTAVSSYQPQHSVSAVQQILSPLQFIHAQPGSTGWMTPYPMMMLPGSSVPQSLLLQSNGATSGMFATADGQVFVAPIGDASGNTLMPVDVSGNCIMQNAAAEVQAQQTAAAASRPAGNRDNKSDLQRQPKKPLTPYMIFSKQIWPQVKAEHAHLNSVTELGAIVGQLWRDLDPSQKTQYNDLYLQDKARYENEVSKYLKETGLAASDLNKPRAKRVTGERPSNKSASAAKNVAAAGGGQNWANGGAVPQVAGANQLPPLFANTDGTVTVGGVTGSDHKPVYSGTQNSQRQWPWPQGNDGSAAVYQQPQAGGGDLSGRQQQPPQYNGIPVSSAAAAVKAWNVSHGRVEQLENEVHRLRVALAGKEREAEELRTELNTLLSSMGEGRNRTGQQIMLSDIPTTSVENNNTNKMDIPAVVNGMPE